MSSTTTTISKSHLQAVPEPWDYNPSRWSQRVRVSLVAILGVVIATYMGLYQWRLIDSVWDPIFGKQSAQVLDSDVSHWMMRYFRIPDAIFGALAYLGDIIFAMAGSTRRWQYRPWLVVLFGLDVIPLGIVSIILVILQGAVVGSWCFLCICTAVVSLALIVLAYDEVWSCLLYLHGVWKRADDKREIWNTFWGRPSNLGAEVANELIQRRTEGHS